MAQAALPSRTCSLVSAPAATGKASLRRGDNFLRGLIQDGGLCFLATPTCYTYLALKQRGINISAQCFKQPKEHSLSDSTSQPAPVLLNPSTTLHTSLLLV